MPVQTEAYLARPGSGIKLSQVTYLDPGPKELLVDIAAASVCHTDVKAAEGTFHIKPPLILGHEASGTIRAVGSGVTAFCPGDNVVLSFAHCNACKACLSGAQPYCEDLMRWNFSGRRVPTGGGEGEVVARDGDGEGINGLFFGQSSMGRVALVQESCAVAVKVREGEEGRRDLVRFASLGCGIQTGAGAIWNVAKPPTGSSILIFGGGAVGLAALLAAKTTAPASIVLVDTSATKLAMIPAEILSGVHVLNTTGLSHEETVAQLKALSGEDKSGFDYALDCVGSAAILAAGCDALAKRGTVMTIGSTSATQAVFRSEVFLVKGLTYRGMHQGDSVPRVMIPEMIRQWRAGRFPFERLLNHFAFEELEGALDDMHHGRVIKPLLVV